MLLLFQKVLCISPEQFKLCLQRLSVAPIGVLSIVGFSRLKFHFVTTDFLKRVVASIIGPVDIFFFVAGVFMERVFFDISPEIVARFEEKIGVLLVALFVVEDDEVIPVLTSDGEIVAGVLMELMESANAENVRNNPKKPTKKSDFFVKECRNRVVFIVKIKVSKLYILM